MALWGIFDRDVAKRLYRHAYVSESLLGHRLTRLGHRLTSHTSTAPPQVGGGVRRAGLIPNRTSVPKPRQWPSARQTDRPVCSRTGGSQQNQILEPSPAIKLIVTARTTAPSRYDSNAWRSTVALIAVNPISVSETWKVIPTV
jgi:hypothetical protein